MKLIRNVMRSHPMRVLSLAVLAVAMLSVVPLWAAGGNFVSIYENGNECKWDAFIGGGTWNPHGQNNGGGSDRTEEAAAGAALIGFGTFAGVRSEGAAHKIPVCLTWTNPG